MRRFVYRFFFFPFSGWAMRHPRVAWPLLISVHALAVLNYICTSRKAEAEADVFAAQRLAE